VVYERPPHLLALLDGFQRRLGQEVTTRMRGTGVLRGSEGRILGLIEPDGTRPTSLAEGSWITKQAIGKRVRELEERGLVSVRPDPDDGRAVRVHRTPKGEAVKATTEQRVAELERAFAVEVGEERYRTFCEVLSELGRG
jgi:DNA-binding MarR family transcriptional regulator